MTQYKRLLLRALEAAIDARRLEERDVHRDGATSEETLFCDTMTLAAQHKVLPLVVDALCDVLPDAKHFETVRGLARRQVAQQTVQTAEFLRLYAQLCAAGVRPLVVKGLSVRRLYAVGDMRPSADEDILVSPDELSACRDVLESAGYTTADSADSFEQTFTSPKSTLRIELHMSLFDPSSPAFGNFNLFFTHAAEHAECICVDGRKIYTLDCTDHLLYLVLHACKHFAHSGFGIRQVCDIAKLATHYANETDISRFADCCRAASAQRFAAALFVLAEEYLALDPEISERFTTALGERPDTVPLLEDILDAGVYGSAERSRLHSAGITLGTLEAQNSGKNTRRVRFRVIFPTRETMRVKYPYLKKHPYLLPTAYASRIFAYLRRQGKSPARAAHIGEERLRLLSEYGIIKEKSQ